MAGRRLVLDPVLLAYVCLTLLGLYALADHLAPLPGREACKIAHVLDGDTLELVCGLDHRRVRLTGLDAPETRDARCPEEKALGTRATMRLRDLVATAQQHRLWTEGQDRYGRELMHLWLDGADVAEILIAEGLATRYQGGARIDWCARIKGG